MQLCIGPSYLIFKPAILLESRRYKKKSYNMKNLLFYTAQSKLMVEIDHNEMSN